MVCTLGHSQVHSVESESFDSILTWMKNHTYSDSVFSFEGFYDIAKRSLARAAVEKDAQFMGDMHTALADWYGYTGQYKGDSLVIQDKRALAYYEEAGDSASIAGTYRVMSMDLQNIGRLDEAQRSVLTAISYYEKMQDRSGLARAHRTLGSLLHTMEEHDESIRYCNLALDYYEGQEEYASAAISLHTIIEALYDLEEYEKAQDAARRCINLIKDNNLDDPFSLARALGRKSKVSLAQGLYNQAIAESQEAFDVAAERGGADGAISYKGGIADVYKVQGKYAEALDIYLAINDEIKTDTADYLIGVYEDIYHCYMGMEDWPKALAFQEKMYGMQFYHQNLKISNLKDEGIIKYETGKKDQALAEQATIITQKNRIQQLGGGVLAALALLLGSLFYNYKKNQKTTKALRTKNEENEFLLKEIHHRVKNNLQILSSLLSLQSNYMEDESAADAILEGRNRVESMGLIHQKLYTKDHRSSIDLKEYIPDLCDYLKDSLLPHNHDISIVPDSKVGLVDVETAIPIGLVVNELVTNSIKYAFDQREKGEISVDLWVNDEEQLCLQVKDDGKGASANTDSSKSTNFGSALVKVLIKKLKGSVQSNKEQGYSTLITFDRYQLVAA